MRRAACTCLVVAGALCVQAPARAQGRITFLHSPPAGATPHEPLVVSGNVFDVADLAKAELVYRIGSGGWKRLALTCRDADTYEATIPGDEVTGEVDYYVEATDWTGTTTAIFASASSPERVPVRGAMATPPVATTATLPPVPGPTATPPASTDDSLGTPIPTGQGAPRLETWEPADTTPKASPTTPKSAPKASSALADELSMFGAEDTIAVASRHEQTATDAPAVVSVITAEQMKALDLRTLADVMKIVPGFETGRDVQGFWRIAVRGRRTDPELLVLYDGHRMNDPYDGRVMWERPVDDLERIEVIRGPGSALYGAGAFSGVVNLVPKREDKVEARVGVGSFGDVQGAVHGGRTLGALVVDGSADFERRDGYQAVIEKDAITTDPDATAGVTDDHRTGFDGSLRARYDLGDGLPLLTADVLVQHEDRGALVGLIDVVGPGSDLSWTQVVADLGGEGAFQGWKIKARGYLDSHATDRLFVLFPAGYSQGQTVYPEGVREDTTVGLFSSGVEATGARELFSGNDLTVGFQLERQAIASFSLKANLNGDQPTDPDEMVEPAGVVFPQRDPQYDQRLVVGLFAEDEWKLAEPLALTAGLRLDDVSGFGLNLSPHLALVYRPSGHFALKALFSRAFRAPTFEEDLSIVAIPPALNSGQAVGFQVDGNGVRTNSLEPVTMTSLELGAEAATRLRGAKASLRANVFWNQFDDPIETVDDTGQPQIVNRDQGVRVVGAEAEGRYELSHERGSTFVNVSWFRAWDLATLATAPDFALLTDVPQLRANWGLVLALGDLGSLTFLAQYGSERRNDARTTLEATRRYRIPAYGLFSVALRSRPFFDHYEATVGVVNVTDLATFDDVPRPDADRLSGLLPDEGVHAMLTLRASY